MAEAETQDAARTKRAIRPVYLNAGKRRPKEIKALKRGQGKLAAKIVAEVEKAVGEIGLDGGSDVIPVVLLYRRKPKRRDDAAISIRRLMGL